MRIDRSDPVDGPDDAHVVRRAQSAPDYSGAAEKDRGTAVTGESAPNSYPGRPDAALRAELGEAHQAKVEAIYRKYAVDNGNTRAEGPEGRTGTPAMGRVEAEGHLKDKGWSAEVTDLEAGGAPEMTDDATTDVWDESPMSDHDGWAWDHGGDVPDDSRNYSNPKTGRLDASWSTYDRAIAAAREHSGKDLGPDSIKMYDYNPETGEGTGTLIGEQTPDRMRGWRIDSQDGHVNWWDWTGGKKGAGGAYGHDWFPGDLSAPGSRYIGWAPWQDSRGNILEGN